MAEGVKNAIARLGLAPHPFEGWFKETDHQRGQSRNFHLLIAAGTHVPWHRLPAQVVWQYKEGDPLGLSQSSDGVTADGIRLGPQGEAKWLVPANTYQTLETMGRWTVLEASLTPDIPISERIHCRENWFPGAGGRG